MDWLRLVAVAVTAALILLFLYSCLWVSRRADDSEALDDRWRH